MHEYHVTRKHSYMHNPSTFTSITLNMLMSFMYSYHVFSYTFHIWIHILCIISLLFHSFTPHSCICLSCHNQNIHTTHSIAILLSNTYHPFHKHITHNHTHASFVFNFIISLSILTTHLRTNHQEKATQWKLTLYGKIDRILIL